MSGAVEGTSSGNDSVSMYLPHDFKKLTMVCSSWGLKEGQINFFHSDGVSIPLRSFLETSHKLTLSRAQVMKVSKYINKSKGRNGNILKNH